MRSTLDNVPSVKEPVASVAETVPELHGTHGTLRCKTGGKKSATPRLVFEFLRKTSAVKFKQLVSLIYFHDLTWQH